MEIGKKNIQREKTNQRIIARARQGILEKNQKVIKKEKKEHDITCARRNFVVFPLTITGSFEHEMQLTDEFRFALIS